MHKYRRLIQPPEPQKQGDAACHQAKAIEYIVLQAAEFALAR